MRRDASVLVDPLGNGSEEGLGVPVILGLGFEGAIQETVRLRHRHPCDFKEDARAFIRLLGRR